MKLDGRVVIVTGASSGIGWRTALLLAEKGGRVVAVARNEARLERLVARSQLHTPAGSITPFPCDLTVAADRARLVEAAGPVDVLVNNAGQGWIGSLARMEEADVRSLFEINVLGLIDLTRRVLPGMLERRSGHVVNVASVAAYVAVPPLTVYSATKFAVLGYTDGLRRETLFSGVTTAVVNPGPIATDFFRRATGGDAGGAGQLSGPGTALVARAILRTIRRRHVPGYQTVAVPRVMGLARMGALPGMARVVDYGYRVVRLSGRYHRLDAGEPGHGGGASSPPADTAGGPASGTGSAAEL